MKLNLGCGVHKMEGWINLDLDYGHDLSKGLPQVFTGVTHVFSEHFIEHITREQARKLLKDCYDSMIEGAVIRISTPDLRLIFHLYNNYDFSKPLMPSVWEPKTPCQYVNEGMRSWGHTFIYDFEELYELLRSCGFDNIKRVRHRDSEHFHLKGLEVRPDYEDLIVEAKKYPLNLDTKFFYY